MKLSRRNFLGSSAATAASIPLLFNANEANAVEIGDINWSMGFPEDAVLLNRNENPIGPSAKAIEAARVGIPKSFRYADPALIRDMLAEQYDLDKEYILVGSGSGEILDIVPIAFARNPGDNIVATYESYRPMQNFAAKFGTKIKWVHLIKEQNYAYDIDGLLKAVDENTKVLSLVTPNNPTGLVLKYEEMKKLADGVPQHVLIVIDEAYIDFQESGKTGYDLVKEGYKNVLVTRTFSKAYALAGLRCGYGIGHPDIMREIDKFGCDPTSMNMACFGAVIASMGDMNHVRKSRNFVKKARSFYQKNFDDMGISYLSGPPIFIMAELGKDTNKIRDELRKRKVFVRAGEEWGMPNHMRISYGFDHENEAFFKELKDILSNIS